MCKRDWVLQGVLGVVVCTPLCSAGALGPALAAALLVPECPVPCLQPPQLKWLERTKKKPQARKWSGAGTGFLELIPLHSLPSLPPSWSSWLPSTPESHSPGAVGNWGQPPSEHDARGLLGTVSTLHFGVGDGCLWCLGAGGAVTGCHAPCQWECSETAPLHSGEGRGCSLVLGGRGSCGVQWGSWQ